MFNKHGKDEKQSSHHDDKHSAEKAKAQQAVKDQATPEEQQELKDKEVKGLPNVPKLNQPVKLSKEQEEHNERQEALVHPEVEKLEEEHKKMSEQLAESQRVGDGTVPAQESVRADIESQKKGMRG